MIKKLLFLLVFTFLTSIASAQTQVPSPIPPTTFIAWDHDRINTDRFELVVDAGTPVDLNLPPANETPFPALTPGNHTLVVRACNIAGCAASDPFVVSVVVIPAVPTNLRIITR